MCACVDAGVGELRVLLQEGSRTTPLWWRSGDQGDAWRRGEVVVGRTPHVFTLFFQATRTFSQLGDIAIDDILFLNCSLPGEQQTHKVTVDRGCVAEEGKQLRYKIQWQYPKWSIAFRGI